MVLCPRAQLCAGQFQTRDREEARLLVQEVPWRHGWAGRHQVSGGGHRVSFGICDQACANARGEDPRNPGSHAGPEQAGSGR